MAEQLKRQLDFWEKQNVLGKKVADLYGENPIETPRMRELFMKDAERAQLHIMDNPNIDEMYGKFMGALPDDVDPLEAYKRIIEVQNDPDMIGMRAWAGGDAPMPELIKEDYHSVMSKIRNGEITPEELDHWILEGALPKKMTADEAYALELDDFILDTKAFKELPSDMLDPNWYLMMQEVY